jgi:hypothetical protein
MLVELDCLHYSKVFASHFPEQAVGVNLFRKSESDHEQNMLHHAPRKIRSLLNSEGKHAATEYCVNI